MVMCFFINMKNVNVISSFKPKRFFIGKSKICEMTQFSGAENKPGFDSNAL